MSTPPLDWQNVSREELLGLLQQRSIALAEVVAYVKPFIGETNSHRSTDTSDLPKPTVADAATQTVVSGLTWWPYTTPPTPSPRRISSQVPATERTPTRPLPPRALIHELPPRPNSAPSAEAPPATLNIKSVQVIDPLPLGKARVAHRAKPYTKTA